MLKYLEIDSTYRNRSRYPNPAQFEIIISQSGRRDNVYTSIDPITYAAPKMTYTPSQINSLAINGTTVSSLATITGIIPTTVAPFVSAISNTISQNTISLIVYFPTLQASRQLNYYRGCQLTLKYTPTGLSATTFTALIDNWTYLNTGPVTLSTTGNTAVPPTVVIGTITNTITVDYFRININTAFPGPTTTVTECSITCPTDFTNGLVFIPGGEYGSQIYDDWYVYNERLNTYTSITTYDGNFSLSSITPQSSWLLTDNISIRKELPVTTGTFDPGSTTTVLQLSSTTSNAIKGYYNGMFIRFTSGTNKNKIVGIYSYTGSPGYEATILGYVSNPPTSSDTYEILPFTRDNYSPFTYSGSIISQESCYDVQLINLIIPNQSLASGGTIASYPYFYVELQNISNAGGNTLNVSYSNNPNSTQKLFRVPVSDFSTQADDAFLTLDKSNSLQTVRINPFGNFKFGVYLPDGSPLTFYQSDTETPSPPNVFLQVSAVFALRRIRG